MSDVSRRKWLRAGLASAAGVTGVAAAATLADRYGLITPGHAGIYGVGDSLTYAAQRLLTEHSMAREFSRDQISKNPFPNCKAPKLKEYESQQAAGFDDWKINIGGLVAKPGSLSLRELKQYPAASQITHLACEEGWSFIAEWTGATLSHVLHEFGIRPEARFVVYHSLEKDWWDSIDMADALHPQTQLTYAMNGAPLPPGHGGPIRMRVPRQLGYKSIKFVTRITVTDNLKQQFSPEGSYSWYAGI